MQRNPIFKMCKPHRLLKISTLVLLFSVFALTSHADSSFQVDQQLQRCHQKVRQALHDLQKADGTLDYTMEPRNILHGDKQKAWNCRKATAEEWCSGFWSGILWMDYGYSHDSIVGQAAEGYTAALRSCVYRPVYDHDLGFITFCSFGKGYEQNHNATYRQTLLDAADSLATLFRSLVGTILSWPRNVKMFGGHNTIMDNMMNLDLLFWASRHGGNPLLYDIAVTHAKTTMKHHFRPDGGCYHVAVYNTLTGDFIKGVTHQGYADNSTWTRGQGWAVYGYTMVYRYTHEKVFLDFAQKVANYYLSRLPEGDLIPKWDFDDPDPKASKDASAACVVADALLELQQYVGGQQGQQYREKAVEMLRQLSSPEYFSGKHNDAFLLHSTGHHPAGSEIDASIVYADYYYLEALLRLRNIK